MDGRTDDGQQATALAYLEQVTLHELTVRFLKANCNLEDFDINGGLQLKGQY